MREISYVVLAFGVLGIALGLYGWLFPTVRERLAAFLHNNDDDFADDETELAADLESRRALALARLESRRSNLEEQRALRPRTPAIAPPPPLPPVAEEPEEDFDLPVIEAEDDDEVIENPVRVVKLEAPPTQDDAAPAEAEPQTQTVAAAAPDLTSVLEEPQAAPSAEDDMLAFFAEAAEESTTSAVLREAIEVVSAKDLLEDARALRALLSGRTDA